MTKKKAKKNQKATSSAPVPAEVQKKEKEAEMEILDDFRRDEDLYISDIDVTNISNFIRTTNKSFNSLGNTVVEKFSGRCSLAILHALIALFDLDSKERDDVIRRLNIIYIVWRLPDLESELRLKPQKNINDVYCHPFSTFLFYAEQMTEHVVESTLARIIVTNNVQVVEKLTAPDFIQKAASLNLHKVDLEAWEKWEEANTDHWPEITEEMVSLSKAMRELGCYSERKDHEAGMAEAFYPLVHNPPTLLPPRMPCQEQEDPAILKYRERVDPDGKLAENVIYSVTAGEDMQDRLKAAFTDLEPTVVEYQSEIFSGMTPSELEEAQREIVLDGPMSQSDDSEFHSESEGDEEEDKSTDPESKAAAALAKLEGDDKLVEGCIDRMLKGEHLSTSRLESLSIFVKNCNLTHPQYHRMLAAVEKEENIPILCRTNLKFTAAILSRHAISEENGCEIFKKYIKLAELIDPTVHAMEMVLKIAKDYTDEEKMTEESREAVLAYVRHTIKHCEDIPNPSGRTIRLVAMLVRKLLRDGVVPIDDIAPFVKPFTLKFSGNRECTALYQLMTAMQAGHTEETISSSNTTMTTTTTTTTSVATNATSTTTTTTVVKQCGPAVIKQTSRKVVLQVKSDIQASSLKAINSMRKSAHALFRKARPPSMPTSSTSTMSSSVTEVKKIMEENERRPDDDEPPAAST